MNKSNDSKAFNAFKIAVFKRLRSLEAELDKIKGIIIMIDNKHENRIDKLEKNLWNFPDQIAREIACDQFLQSVEMNEAGEIISEDEKDKEDPLFDF